MIDWNKRNGGFLSPESVYEDQLGNLSNQIDELRKENNKCKEKIIILKEIVATYEMDKNNEDKFIEDLKRILWDKDEGK